MGRDIAAGILVVFMALIAVAALFFGALGGSSTITYDDSASVPAPVNVNGGLVYGKHETGGMRFLGFDFRSRERWLSVGFVAPPECLSVNDAGEQVVLASGDCAALPGSGLVQGGGTTVDRIEWVMVQVQVSQACYQAIGSGDAWPSDLAACSGG